MDVLEAGNKIKNILPLKNVKSNKNNHTTDNNENCDTTNNGESDEKNKDKKTLVSQDDIMKMLSACYSKAVDGIPLVSSPIEDLAEEYLKKYNTKEKAIKAMIKNQVIKCTTSGFITGFGGFITMPVTIPANLASVMYVQMRMIGCCAYIAGHDLDSDQTQTFVYACLAGISLNNILKQAGIKFGLKFAQNIINKIPGKVLTKINQKVGFRFITKAGTKGIVNLSKAVPVVGAVLGGGLDFAETKIIANRAYKWFIEGNVDEKDSPEDIVAENFEDNLFDIEVNENENLENNLFDDSIKNEIMDITFTKNE